MSSFRIVIPARYESTRLPGKVLLELAGKPLVQHVWERATESGAGEVVIATDNERVAAAASGFGADVCMTSAACNSGTDRVAEVCTVRGWDDSQPVVNVQGDAPLIPPLSIRKVAELLVDNPSAELATLCVALDAEAEISDPNVVKVVFDCQGRALYFSRSVIPARGHDPQDAAATVYRHLGIYGYRPSALQRLSQTAPCELEQSERLEQLRALWLGMTIMVGVDPEAVAPDVDTAEDAELVERLLVERAG